MPHARAPGARPTITTVEGLAGRGSSPVQQAFSEAHALQCGYCTPGFLLSSVALADRGVDLAGAALREELAGNLCRCTGYQNIVEAVERYLRQAPRDVAMDKLPRLGASVKRKEDERLLRGSGRFVDDVEETAVAPRRHRPLPVPARAHCLHRRHRRRSRAARGRADRRGGRRPHGADHGAAPDSRRRPGSPTAGARDRPLRGRARGRGGRRRPRHRRGRAEL